jgi:hypothetical protein
MMLGLGSSLTAPAVLISPTGSPLVLITPSTVLAPVTRIQGT